MEQNQLLNTINGRLERNDLILPTLPDVALEINDKITNPDIEISDVVSMIKKDPAIAASVIKFSNSALVKGNVQINSIERATIRIGLKRLKHVIMSFAIQQIFFAKDVGIAIGIASAWKQASGAAVSCGATLQLLKLNGHAKELDPDVMFLVALVHNIGFLPVLSEADRLGREQDARFFNKEFLHNVSMSTGIKLTARILREWNFEDEIIEPASRWPEISYNPAELSYLHLLRLGLTNTDFICDEIKSIFVSEAINRGIINDDNWAKNDEFKKFMLEYKDIF